MKYYFSMDRKFSLSIFGPIHILLILVTILSIFLIYKNREKLKKCKNLKYWIVGILFSNMLIYMIGALLTKAFNIYDHLPLHYCYITGFFFMYMLLKEKKSWYNFLYYAVFFCTTTVIIFQDPGITYDRYEFIMLVISHHFLLISSFWTLFVLDYPVNKEGYKSFALYTMFVYLSVFIINRFLETDYIFNKALPDFIYEHFVFVKYLPPIVWLLIISIPLLLLAYLPIKFLNNKCKVDTK